MPIFRLEAYDTSLHPKRRYLPGISSLLRNSRFLETLTIYVYPGRDEDESELAFDYDGFIYWSSVDSAYPCFKHQLKHVKIYGYVLDPDVIELIEFLFKNAQVLEKMKISSKKILQRIGSKNMFSSDIGRPLKDYCTSDALLEFSQKLLSFPRASTQVVIHLG
ncbi:hypothetical protein EUGRSUZ_C03098 [Eucalyptus grandis]|uniref:Uncharacterized protein n=2 Tax=Eucalyptus grandis TaxID=71139 RepID=A0ACC3LJJ0_EUCGR|nr:hypothetical protein EUGRSUZ_C03098 [Eucalyptus grandis]